MPDLLTHVLTVYVVASVISWKTSLPERYVPVICVGATMPDVMKAAILADVHSGTAFGIPYSFWGIHTIGGVLVLAGIGAVTITGEDRRLAYFSLLAGGVSHLVLDSFVIRVDGLAPPYLFPFSNWLPPAGNAYASTDLWPVVVAVVIAVPIWFGWQRR